MRLIGQLCEDRRVLAEKAQKAREKALTFSWEVVARAYREWYGDVLG
jgi:glycosyltransferase involved in cell wall biosynthesis